MSSLPAGVDPYANLSLAVFDSGNYCTVTDAIASGALYICPSQPSLTGDSGLKDAEDIVYMVQDCFGVDTPVLCVRNNAGTWVEVV